MSALRGRWSFVLLHLVCATLLVDQFGFSQEERSVYLDKQTWMERRSTKGGYSRWSRRDPHEHRWSAYTASAWYTAHLENGRWFQLGDHDNGVLQHGDSVRVVVAPITGRVLRFQRLAKGVNRERTTADAYEDLVPFPVLLAGLCIWVLLARPGSDTVIYLRGTIVVVSLVFLLALFAMSWPLMRALGWA